MFVDSLFSSFIHPCSASLFKQSHFPESLHNFEGIPAIGEIGGIADGFGKVLGGDRPSMAVDITDVAQPEMTPFHVIAELLRRLIRKMSATRSIVTSGSGCISVRASAAAVKRSLAGPVDIFDSEIHDQKFGGGLFHIFHAVRILSSARAARTRTHPGSDVIRIQSQSAQRLGCAAARFCRQRPRSEVKGSIHTESAVVRGSEIILIRELLIILQVVVERNDTLLDIGKTGNAFCRFLRSSQRREKQRGQNRDDRNKLIS